MSDGFMAEVDELYITCNNIMSMLPSTIPKREITVL